MATREIVEILDDIDGTPEAETVEFSFKHVTYTIDLSQKNQAELMKALQPYVEAGKKTSRGRGGAPTHDTKRRDLDAIRTWARANGHSVSDRGRIKANIVSAYDEAQKS